MSAQDQVIWTGHFELDEALAQFNIFADKVQAKFNTLTQSATGNQKASTKDRVLELLKDYEIAAEQAEIKLEGFKATVKSALDKGLIDPVKANSILQSLDNKLQSLGTRVEKINHKLEENIHWTNSDVLALRGINSALDNFDLKLNQADRSLALTNLRIEEQDKAFKEFFYRIVVGGFALQQLGTLMTNTVTRPMIELGKTVFNAGLEFEQFEKRLEIVAGKSKKQIAEIYDTVRKVAKEPNITLTETMQLFNNLLTIGKDRNLSTQQLEVFGKGYTRALEAVTATEKKSVLDFITDVFATGEFGQNVEKSLQLAPRLNKAMRDVLGGNIDTKSLQKSGLDAFDVLMKAMQNLANQPAADSIQNQIDNIIDKFIVLGNEVFKVYKDRLLVFLNWLDTKALPVLNEFGNWLKNTTPFIQDLVLSLTALAAAAGPLVYIFGTLGVVGGGLAFIIKAIASGIALITGNTIAASIATSGLGSLLATQGSFLATAGTWITKIIALLPRLAVLITPIGIIFTAVVALIILTYQKSELFRASVAHTVTLLGSGMVSVLVSILKLVQLIGVAWTGLGDLLEETGVLKYVGYLLSGILDLSNIITSRLGEAFASINIIIQLFIDLINNGATFALNNFKASIFEFIQSMVEVSSIVHSIVNGITKLITGEDFDTRMAKNIGEARKETKKFGDTIGEAAKKVNEGADGVDTFTKNLEASAKATKNQIEFLDKLAEALKKEQDQLDQNALSQHKLNMEREGKASAAIGEYQIEKRDRATEETDYSNPTELSAREAAIAANAVTRLNLAKAERIRRIALARYLLLESTEKDLTKQLDEIIKDKLDPSKGINIVFEKLIESIKQSRRDGGSIVDRLNEVYTSTLNEWGPTDTAGQQWKETILKRVLAIAQNFVDIYQQEAKSSEEIDKAVRENEREREDFLDRRRKAANERKQILETASLSGQKENIESQLEAQNELAEVIKRGADTTNNIRVQLDTLADIQAKMRELNEQLLNKEEEIDLAQATTDNQRLEIQGRYKTLRTGRKNELDQKYKKDSDDFLETVLQRGKRNQEGIRKAIEEYQKGSLELLSLYRELAEYGIKSDAEYAQVEDQIRKSQLTQNLTLKKSLGSLYEVLEKDTGAIPGKYLASIQSLKKALGEVAGTSFNDSAKLGAFIEQSVTLLGLFSAIPEGAFSDKITKAEFDVVVERLVKGLQEAKQIQTDTLKTEIELKQKSYEYDKSKYEQQSRILETKATELDLEKELLDLRRERGQIILDIKNVRDFGKAIIAAITGGANAAYELEKRILENQKLRAQNELNLLLLRLEYEKAILILQADGDASKITRIEDQFKILEENLKRENELQTEILDEKIRGLAKYGTTITEIFTNVLGQAASSIFKKKKKEPDFNIDAGGVDAEGNVIDSVVTDEAADKTGDNVSSTLGWLDKLRGGLGQTKDVIFALGGALENLNDLSLKGIARALKEELKALGKKATIKALEYAAVALSALVFGDYSTATKAGLAAAAWGVVAVASYAGAGVLGTLDGDSAKNSASSQSAVAGYDYKKDYDASRDNQILKQKLLSVLIQLDIRTDNGQIIKINEREINRNTQLTTLVANSAGDWLTQPGV